MATVYLAHEPARDRYLALKVLAESYHGTLEAERFRREARVLTTLRHPNILRAYDAGSQGSHDWYSMPFVGGESLRERLDRERHLPIHEACRLAIDVLAALAHSHASEIIHRDVKPDNVLLAAHGALLADFGIARRVELPDAREPTVATARGVAVGTPAYMSPEQIAAERSIDGRSDVYSAAVLLYECLSGTLPITGKSARDFMARHMTEEPVPLRWVAPDVPESIAQAVQRGLAKSPSARFESASAFRQALVEALHRNPPDALSSYGVPALSMAPLEFSGLPQDRWIALGAEESIVSALRNDRLRVVGRRGPADTPTARWRVAGTCSVANAVVRVALSVTDHVSASTHALEGIEGHAADFVALHRAAARRVRTTLAARGLLGDASATDEPDRSALAEALYLRGRATAQHAATDEMLLAASYFERAIQNEPRHVRALEALAGTLLHLAVHDDPGALQRVIVCADMALAIDPKAPVALFHKGTALARFGEWTDAIECVERAVAGDPESAESHYALGRYRLMQALCTPVWEQLGRAVRPLTRAIALDAAHLPSYRELAAVYLYAGDDDEAQAVLQAANDAERAFSATMLTPASGRDTLQHLAEGHPDPHDLAVRLLTAVLDANGDDRDTSARFPARVCCAVGLDGDRMPYAESARLHFHPTLSITRAHHVAP